MAQPKPTALAIVGGGGSAPDSKSSSSEPKPLDRTAITEHFARLSLEAEEQAERTAFLMDDRPPSQVITELLDLIGYQTSGRPETIAEIVKLRTNPLTWVLDDVCKIAADREVKDVAAVFALHIRKRLHDPDSPDSNPKRKPATPDYGAMQRAKDAERRRQDDAVWEAEVAAKKATRVANPVKEPEPEPEPEPAKFVEPTAAERAAKMDELRALWASKDRRMPSHIIEDRA